MEGPRAATPQELGKVAHLIDGIFRAGTDQNLTTDYPLVFSQANLNNVSILLEKGATEPDFRNRGLASQVVEQCLRRMQDEDCAFGILWTNSPSVYFRTGWEVIASNGWVYLLPTESSRHLKQTHRVRSCLAEKDLESLMAIHDSLSFRIVRSRSDYEALYSLPKIEVWVAEKETTIAGYMVVAEGYNKAGVVEWGGIPAALESLLAHALPRTKRTPLEVPVPLWPNPMTTLLSARENLKRIVIEDMETSGPKMVRIVSLTRLIEHLVPHIRSRLADCSGAFALTVHETGERVSVQIQNGHVTTGSAPTSSELTLSLRQLARLMFGPEKPSMAFHLGGELGLLLDRLFPFHFHIWMLDYV